jgi:hypothetical protein
MEEALPFPTREYHTPDSDAPQCKNASPGQKYSSCVLNFEERTPPRFLAFALVREIVFAYGLPEHPERMCTSCVEYLCEA